MCVCGSSQKGCEICVPGYTQEQQESCISVDFDSSRLGSDTCAKLMANCKSLAVVEPNLQEWLVDHLTVKLASGEGFASLHPEDYNNILEYLAFVPKTQKSFNLGQLVGDFVSNNQRRFSADEKSMIGTNLMALSKKVSVPVVPKQNRTQMNESIKFGLGVSDVPDLELGFSGTESAYTVHFKPLKTSL